MSHKRTKKDVEDAYRRGFEAGFNVRPNPIAMILRSAWRKHELKKLKKAWKEHVERGIVYGGHQNRPLGIVKSFSEDEKGLNVEVELNPPDA